MLHGFEMMLIGTCHGIRYKNAVYCPLYDLWLESGLRHFIKQLKNREDSVHGSSER
jgi:hypothetical protein